MRSYLEISCASLIENYRSFKSILPSNQTLYAVVKGNAYGHGIKEVVSILDRVVDAFCVEDADELKILRSVTRRNCLVLGHVGTDELDATMIANTAFSLFSWEQLPIFESLSTTYGQEINVHLKIDALLGRQGFLIDEVESLCKVLLTKKQIVLAGVYGHLSSVKLGDLRQSDKQVQVFARATAIVDKFFGKSYQKHLSASGGLAYLDNSIFDAARLGAGLYGIWPEDDKLNPAIRWVSGVTQVKMLPAGYPVGYDNTFVTERETKLAVIAQGYADGYDRQLSNLGTVLIGGTRCKILGKISMNVMVADVSHLGEMRVGDEVVLLGRQGDQTITVHELARLAETNSYEIVTRISPLLQRVLVN